MFATIIGLAILIAIVYKQADHIPKYSREDYAFRLVMLAFFRFWKVAGALCFVVAISFWWTRSPAFTPIHYIVCLVVMDWAWLSYKTRRFC